MWPPHLVLECLVGRPLDEALARRRRVGRGALSVREAVGLLLPAIDALAEAHAQRTARRDIKPTDLFLAHLGTRTSIKVLDFGIAKVLTNTASLTRALEPAVAAPRRGRSGIGRAVVAVLAATVAAGAAIVGAFWWLPRSAPEKASVDNSSAESATAPEPAKAAPTRTTAAALPPIPGRMAGPLRTADGDRWVTAFRFELPAGATTGVGWVDARTACHSVDLDLCTEDQWLIACDNEREVSKVPSWTMTYSGSGFVVRGGGSCGERRVSESSYRDPTVTASLGPFGT